MVIVVPFPPEFLPDAVADAMHPLVWKLFEKFSIIASPEAIFLVNLVVVAISEMPSRFAREEPTQQYQQCPDVCQVFHR